MSGSRAGIYCNGDDRIILTALIIEKLKETFPANINFNDGYVINIDKPLNWTSADVVRKIKYMLRHEGYKKIKVGHAGTLDPLATGVLLICVGKATKQAEALQAERKEYITDIMLGATTPSYDLEHPIDRTFPYEHITRDILEQAIIELCGERLQVPPVYSAKKIDGLRAYEYAREGVEIEMKKALINIYNIEILAFELPVVKLRVECSKGTYIRSLAMELGEKLQSGAYLTSLRRTRSGDFKAEEGYSIEEIKNSFDKTKQIQF